MNYSIKYQQLYNIPKTYLAATLKYMNLILEGPFTQSKQLIIFSKKIQFKHAVMLHVVILQTQPHSVMCPHHFFLHIPIGVHDIRCILL